MSIIKKVLAFEIAVLVGAGAGGIGQGIMWDNGVGIDETGSAQVQKYQANLAAMKASKDKIARLEQVVAAPELLSLIDPDDKTAKLRFDKAKGVIDAERKAFNDNAYKMTYNVMVDAALPEEKAQSLVLDIYKMMPDADKAKFNVSADNFRGLRECQLQMALAPTIPNTRQAIVDQMSSCSQAASSKHFNIAGGIGVLFSILATSGLWSSGNRTSPRRATPKSDDKRLEIVIKRK